MGKFYPPQKLEDAKKFAVCVQYRDYWCCVYVGGGSPGEHNMYWAYIIYDANGDRIEFFQLPSWCLDVDDGLKHCQTVVDYWLKPLDYEEIRIWRDICELLSGWAGMPPAEIIRRIPNSQRLLSYDRTRRSLLWDLYKIQLVTWEDWGKGKGCWRLKGNWEDKIHFLEQVYVLGRDPDALPRPWLDKWERKQQREKREELERNFERSLERIANELKLLEVFGLDMELEFYQEVVGAIAANAKEAKHLLQELAAQG